MKIFNKWLTVMVAVLMMIPFLGACTAQDPTQTGSNPPKKQETVVLPEIYRFSQTEFVTLTCLDWTGDANSTKVEKKIGVGNYVDVLKQILFSLEKTGDTVSSLSEPALVYLLTLDGQTFRFDSRFSTAALVTSPSGIGVALKMTPAVSRFFAQTLQYAPDNTYEGTVKAGKGEITNVFPAESSVKIVKATLRMPEDAKNKVSVLFDSAVAQDVMAEVQTFQSKDSVQDNYCLDPVSLRGGEQIVTFEFRGFDDVNDLPYDLQITVTTAEGTRTSLILHIEP